ncbi:MAG TPA: VacJ family lipoprotein [Candidatus Margulisiibacteriota bacterium]|nr:VacJ family lipoprotein [Candidatus Margulisiibacteriota bacterium]
MSWLRYLTLAVVLVGLAGLPLPAHAAAAAEAESNHDPLEGFNRGMFWFNDKLDLYVIEPVAKGWDKVMPDAVQHSIRNFFSNLRFPIVAGNALLQAKFKQAGSDVGRFVVNTTVGVAGFFDPATGWGLPAHDEDFGQTLGYWGTPPGPYLVLPFFGPSDPRDTVGLAADSFSTVYPFFIVYYYTFGARAIDLVNTRAHYLKQVKEAKEASLDYYSAVRNAYVRRRKALVNDETGISEKEAEYLYNVDTDEE